MHILSMSHIYKRSQLERNWPSIELALFFDLFLFENHSEHRDCFVFIVPKKYFTKFSENYEYRFY